MRPRKTSNPINPSARRVRAGSASSPESATAPLVEPGRRGGGDGIPRLAVQRNRIRARPQRIEGHELVLQQLRFGSVVGPAQLVGDHPQPVAHRDPLPKPLDRVAAAELADRREQHAPAMAGKPYRAPVPLHLNLSRGSTW